MNIATKEALLRALEPFSGQDIISALYSGPGGVDRLGNDLPGNIAYRDLTDALGFDYVSHLEPDEIQDVLEVHATPCKVTIYTTTYAPWEEGDDEPLVTDDRGETFFFASVLEVADLAKDRGIVHASSSHFHSSMWYSSESEMDMDGTRTEESLHVEGLSDSDQAILFDMIGA